MEVFPDQYISFVDPIELEEINEIKETFHVKHDKRVLPA